MILLSRHTIDLADKEFSTYVKQKKYDYEEAQYLSEGLLMKI